MKKLIVIFAVLISAYSCTTDNEQVESEMISIEMAAKKSSNNVQLLTAFASNSSSPVQKSFIRRFTVKVKNIAFEKKVVIHHSTKEGSWIDIPLSFEHTLESNEEIWSGQVDFDNDYLASEFVVQYLVDGKEFWDNNAGENYFLNDNEGAYLAPEIKISLDPTYTRFSGNYFNVNVDAKYNYGAPVEVEVRYTTDDWVTSYSKMLSYQRYYRVGYTSYILSPNRYDAAKYETSVRFDDQIESIEFALVYRINGKEYWDNNYGKNYRLAKNHFFKN